MRDHGESRLWCGHLRACLDATTPSYGSQTTAAAASHGGGGADPNELSRRWRALPWAKQRELFKSWAQPCASGCCPGDLRLSWWWDVRSLGFGQYGTWSDEDKSTQDTTTDYQVWLSASGTRVYRKESSWCYSPAENVILVSVVAGLAVGAAKLLLWLW